MSSQPGDMLSHFKRRFRTVKVLGKGSFGSVFEVLDKTDTIKKALKVVLQYLWDLPVWYSKATENNTGLRKF